MANPLFFQRRFLPMWLGQAFGALADNMNRQILLVGVPYGGITLAGLTRPDSALPYIVALFPIAMLLGSMYGGQFAEKYETSMMFRRTKIAELVMMALAGFGLFYDQGWFVLLALFGMGLQSSFFNPVRQAAMPKYLEANELIRGNGLINAGLYTCILLGYGIGGFLISIEPNGRQLAAITLFAFSVLGYLSIRFAPLGPPTNPDLKINWSGWKPAAEMITYTIKEESVIRPLLGISLFYFVSTIITGMLPLYGRDTLGADGTVTTLFLFLFAFGAGVGAIISATLAKGKSGMGFATFGVSAATVATIAVFVVSLTFTVDKNAEQINAVQFLRTGQGALLAALLCSTSIFMGLFLAPLQAAVQRRAPNDYRARILASGNMFIALSALIGALAIIPIAEKIILPEVAFAIVAAIFALISLYMVKRRNDVPSGLYDEMLKPASEQNKAS